tara:strand:- start:863 stop:994 length:132 start_codon:yes stop_codon:yes gene_type:complete
MEETLDLIKSYVNITDNLWLQRQVEILEVQIRLELENAKQEYE